MWRMCEWPDLNPPLPFARKRFAAPRLVFSFGMTYSSRFIARSSVALAGRAAPFRSPMAANGPRTLVFGSADVSALARRDHHHHLPPFHEWLLFDGPVVLEVRLHSLKQLHAQFLVHHLPPSEAESHLRLVAVRQELDQVPKLDLVVALFGSGPEFDFLDLDLFLLPTSGLRLLVLLEHELAIVHDPADRRFGSRRDFDEVQPGGFGATQRLVSRHDADLFTVRTDDANLRRRDLRVASHALGLDDS